MGIVITEFQIEDEVGKLKFFQKTFVVTVTKFEMILRIFFLKLNNANLSFSKKTLT